LESNDLSRRCCSGEINVYFLCEEVAFFIPNPVVVKAKVLPHLEA
jgi:hypothetical protein